MDHLPTDIIIFFGLALVGMFQSLFGVVLCAFPRSCGKHIIYTGAAMSVIFGGLAIVLILFNLP